MKWPPARTLDVAAAGTILFSAVARALTMPSRVPWWDIDPTRSWTAETTLTPALQFTLDALVWLAIGITIISAHRKSQPIHWRTGLLFFMGCIGVFLHAFVLTPLIGPQEFSEHLIRGGFSHLLAGSAWASAIGGAWAMAHLAREQHVWRFALMLLLGSVTMFLWKGAFQVFVEHSEQVQHFIQNRDVVLASQNIEPGSAASRIFERRLRQAEATGWFGLSNVYASIMAASFAGWLVIAIASWRQMRNRTIGTGEFGIVVLAMIATLVGIALAGSKGGAVAAFVGLAMTALIWLPPFKAMPGGRKLTVFYLLLAIPLALVVLRGVIGTRLGELSVLFRWQYLLGAWNIIVEHPIFGTGPSGFKDAYLLARLPTSPEEVESPHSVFVDWLSTLGVFGLAWVILVLCWVRSMCRALVNSQAMARPTNPPQPDSSTGAPVRSFIIVVALVLAFSLWVEWQRITPDVAFLMATGAAFWVLVSVIAWRAVAGAALEATLVASAMVGATVVLLHSQIELALTLSNSAPIAMLFIGLAAAPVHRVSPRPLQRQPWCNVLPAQLGAAMSFVVSAALMVYIGLIVLPWQRELYAAAASVRDLSEIRQQASQVLSDPSLPPSQRSQAISGLFDRIVRTTGQPIERSPQGLTAGMAALTDQSVQSAIPFLHAADGLIPSTDRPLHWAARLLMENANQKQSQGEAESARADADEAIAIGRQLADRFPNSSSAWSRLAGLYRARGQLMGSPQDLRWSQRCWQVVLTLDPQSLTPRWRLFELSLQLEDHKQARRWAEEAARVNDLLGLDPLEQLSREQLLQIERSLDSEAGDRP